MRAREGAVRAGTSVVVGGSGASNKKLSRIVRLLLTVSRNRRTIHGMTQPDTAETYRTLEERIAEYHLRMTVTRIDARPDRDGDWVGARHWRCHIMTGKGNPQHPARMWVNFSQGSAFHADPELLEVLDCLVSDASSANGSFEDFCSELGWDTDSRKAERTYRACKRTRAALVRLVGESGLDDLAYRTERL